MNTSIMYQINSTNFFINKSPFFKLCISLSKEGKGFKEKLTGKFVKFINLLIISSRKTWIMLSSHLVNYFSGQVEHRLPTNRIWSWKIYKNLLFYWKINRFYQKLLVVALFPLQNGFRKVLSLTPILIIYAKRMVILLNSWPSTSNTSRNSVTRKIWTNDFSQEIRSMRKSRQPSLTWKTCRILFFLR